jgi:uncharacterized membrane protein
MQYSVGNVFVTTIHVISAILAVGGVAFLRFAVLPYAETLSEEDRNALMANVRKRFVPFLHGSYVMLILTGIHHITRLIRSGLVIPHVLLTKIAIALVIVFIGVALTTSKGFEGMKAHRRGLMTFNLILAAMVVFMGIWVTHR